MQIGEQIRLKRNEQHLSQKQLATRAGISATYLCDIEKGRCDGSVKALQSVSVALKIELSELLKYEEG